jgi:hypothetical protein
LLDRISDIKYPAGRFGHFQAFARDRGMNTPGIEE